MYTAIKNREEYNGWKNNNRSKQTQLCIVFHVFKDVICAHIIVGATLGVT